MFKRHDLCYYCRTNSQPFFQALLNLPFSTVSSLGADSDVGKILPMSRLLPTKPPQLHSETSLALPSPFFSSELELEPFSPRKLAIALTILEGEKYRRIRAAECVAYFCEPHSVSNTLTEALNLNENITNWVKWYILRHDHHKKRASVKRLFVDIAQVNSIKIGLMC
jgi:hypothetical protein